MTLKIVIDLKPFDVASIGFEKQFGVPRFEIDTKDVEIDILCINIGSLAYIPRFEIDTKDGRCSCGGW